MLSYQKFEYILTNVSFYYSMKRSGSGNLDDLPGEGEFRRGGVRATAGPRLGWTSEPPVKQK